ncbi:MAG: antitoxin [Acidimicrobiia bacterium]|nr:antitoxin [Acidimicrobiia bacterium]
MTDILIRGLSDDAVAAIEANARRAGLSRAEYLRRTLERERHTTAGEVTVESLARVCETFADLGDADVMRAAWS